MKQKILQKKEIEKSKLNFYMQFFIFNLPYTKKIDKFNDEYCGIYLFSDYEEYIDENFKFNRQKFLENQKKEYDFL